jgi:hypothetical protein
MRVEKQKQLRSLGTDRGVLKELFEVGRNCDNKTQYRHEARVALDRIAPVRRRLEGARCETTLSLVARAARRLVACCASFESPRIFRRRRSLSVPASA